MKFILILIILATAAQAEPLRLSLQQSPRQGEIVRLPDGRLVPYSDNPAERVICQDTCQPETSRRRPYGWLIVGAIAGGALWWSLTESTPSPVVPPVSLPPAVSASPLPLPSPTPAVPTPEPATILLLTTGVLLLFRRKTR